MIILKGKVSVSFIRIRIHHLDSFLYQSCRKRLEELFNDKNQLTYANHWMTFILPLRLQTETVSATAKYVKNVLSSFLEPLEENAKCTKQVYDFFVSFM